MLIKCFSMLLRFFFSKNHIIVLNVFILASSFSLLSMEPALAICRCSSFVNFILNNPSMLIDHFIILQNFRCLSKLSS